MKGKNYANRKPESERPLNDFYQTPKCMTWELLNTNYLQNHNVQCILDPCCGKSAIGNELLKSGFFLSEGDLIYGQDFFTDIYDDSTYDAIVMNPHLNFSINLLRRQKKFLQ